ncbi:MAG: PilN domain-containing protein [Clostridia bacterium]|nr:PilN domain-containing protein [Clostridia bacterium]
MKDFNFLDEYYDSNKYSDKRKRITFEVIIIVVLIVVVICAIWLPRKILDNTIESSYNIKKDLDEIGLNIEQGKNIQDELEQKEELIEILKGLEAEKIVFSKLYPMLIDMVPEDVDIETISYNLNDLQISGSSYTKRDISEFMINLGGLDVFKDIELSNVVYVGSSNKNNFEIKCTFAKVME